ALLARSRQVVQDLCAPIDSVDRVPLAQGEIEIAVRGDRDRARPSQWCALHRRAVRGRPLLSRARVRGDHAARRINPPDTVIADVANQEPAIAIEGDAVRLSQPGLRGWSAVAAEPGCARACDRADGVRPHVYLADDVIIPFGHVQIALAVEPQFVR